MSCILDIDLDYFRMVDRPFARLRKMLAWAGKPVRLSHRRHHHAFLEWARLVKAGELTTPHFIIHVDEHHDMMNELDRPNIGNVIYQAMQTWPACRVYWLTPSPIDSPAMWLTDETWAELKGRFTVGASISDEWPRPDLLSVTKNTEFVPPVLADQLCEVLDE